MITSGRQMNRDWTTYLSENRGESKNREVYKEDALTAEIQDSIDDVHVYFTQLHAQLRDGQVPISFAIFDIRLPSPRREER
jgi:hypothetical protein